MDSIGSMDCEGSEEDIASRARVSAAGDRLLANLVDITSHGYQETRGQQPERAQNAIEYDYVVLGKSCYNNCLDSCATLPSVPSEGKITGEEVIFIGVVGSPAICPPQRVVEKHAQGPNGRRLCSQKARK